MASSTSITHRRQLVYKKPQFAQPPTATQLGLLRRSRIYSKPNSTVMVLGQELSTSHAGAREFAADTPMNKSSFPSEENRRMERHPSGNAKGFVDDMRAVAMRLHTRDQAREGNKIAKGPEERTLAMWKPTVDGYLKFLVDSKLVYETLESIVEQASIPYYEEFRNTGLERSEKLAKDLEWFEEQDHEIPEPSNPGRTYAKHLQELSGKDPQAFICHFYNVYFAHSAGGRMIGRKVADAILDKKELEFYKWDGDLPKLLQNVRENLNKVAEGWSIEEKNHCLEETEKSFKYSGDLLRLILSID